MDDIVVRPRYPRYKSHRRKKRYSRNSGDLSQKIALQVLICLGIFAFAAMIKYVNMPLTDYLKEKASVLILQDVDLKGLFEGIDSFVNALSNGGRQKKTDDIGFDEKTLPASTQDGAVMGEEYENPEYTGEDEADNGGEQDSGITGSQDKMISRSDNGETTVQKLPGGVSLTVPVEGPLGSPFGERMHPIRKEMIFHKGVDIEANKGDPIRAVLDGEVIEADSEKSLGNYIKLSHPGGLVSIYAHCSVLDTKKGKKVKQGDVIAKVGSTGAAVGSHLHFELWKDGTAIDPQLYMNIPVKN